MREILFRGKRIDNGEWVYGDLSQHKTGKKFIKSGCAIHAFEVIPDTICEYTGLSDKKGTKIFEGDIVRITPPQEDDKICVPTPRNPREDMVLQVVFYKGVFSFDMSKRIKCGCYMTALRTYETDRLEVIGNIYDNPKLLEVQDDNS